MLKFIKKFKMCSNYEIAHDEDVDKLSAHNSSLSLSTEIHRQDLFRAECEVMTEGGPDRKHLFERCRKNPGHDQFIPVDQFDIGHLPPVLRSMENLEHLRGWVDRTVKLVVTVTSPDRPDTYPATSVPFPYRHLRGRENCLRCGTGFITRVEAKRCPNKPCCCPRCVKCKTPQWDYYEVEVSTAAHVVFDEYEAFNCVVECFYDSEDRKGVKKLFGITATSMGFCDSSRLICTTHDEDVVAKLSEMTFETECFKHPECDWGVIISHPHGCSKRISVGECQLAYRIKGKNQLKEDQFHLPLELVINSKFSDHSFNIEVPINIVESGCENIQEYGKGTFLPKGTKWRFPSNSDCDLKISSMNRILLSVPIGTQYQLPGGEIKEFPAGASIRLPSNVSDIIFYRLTYDISTCPGCSGAPVLLFHTGFDQVASFTGFNHCGAFLDGTNRSCFQERFSRFQRLINRHGPEEMWQMERDNLIGKQLKGKEKKKYIKDLFKLRDIWAKKKLEEMDSGKRKEVSIEEKERIREMYNNKRELSVKFDKSYPYSLQQLMFYFRLRNSS